MPTCEATQKLPTAAQPCTVLSAQMPLLTITQDQMTLFLNTLISYQLMSSLLLRNHIIKLNASKVSQNRRFKRKFSQEKGE